MSYSTLVDKTTLGVHVDGLGCLSLVTRGKVAVCCYRENRELLKVYDLNNGQLIWNFTSEGMKGMTKVSVGGKLCLAISFRYDHC